MHAFGTDLSNAATAYARALIEWHSTPGGMRELEAKIDRLSSRPGTQEDIALLEHDLLQGRTVRQRQMAAFAAASNPVGGLSNSALKAELSDLITNRMPTMADDPDGLVMEQARFNAVLDEITARRTDGTWRTGRDLPVQKTVTRLDHRAPAHIDTTHPAAWPPPENPHPTPAQTVSTAASQDEDDSPFAIAASTDTGTRSASPYGAPAPITAPIPVQPTDAWMLTRGHTLYMPGEGQVTVLNVQRREDSLRGIKFVEMELHNTLSGETKSRRYPAEEKLQRVEESRRHTF